ncbi:MAG: hypothetical protein ACREVG_15590 [Burkholderiales bacterium]
MLNEVVDKYPQDQVSLHVVWLPMVFGDDESAAKSTGKMYGRDRVHQYYDGARLVGLAYRGEVFSNCLQDALSVMPKDHPLYAQLSECATTSEVPLWDAVLFYPPGVEWKEQVPQPAAWSKQVGFIGPDAGEITGMFFRNDCKQLPTDSDWHDEVRNGMKTLEQPGKRAGSQGQRIELLGFPGCPNTPTIRKNLESALRGLNRDAAFQDVTLEALPRTDRRRS